MLNIQKKDKTFSALSLLSALTAFLFLSCISCGSDKTEESPSVGLVIINEAACQGRDWMEIVNVSAADVDISLWSVSDDLYKDHKYFLPEGTLIQSGEYLVVKQQKDLEEGFAFGLKCAEETAYLFDADGALVDEVELGDPAYGSTWGRLPDLTGLWRETYPTEGDPNEETISAVY